MANTKPFMNIELAGALSEAMSTLFSNSIGSDVTFLLDDGQQRKAHRAILALQSPVFEKMLLDTAFRESRDEVIKLPGKSAIAFEKFLKFIYTCSFEIFQPRLDIVLDMLLMAHEYQVKRLYDAFVAKLKERIYNDSVLLIFEAAFFLQDKELIEACRQYLFENAEDVLKNPQFYELSKPALIDIISQDMFYAPEIDILFAVNCWHERNKTVDIQDVLAQIRFAYVRLPAGMEFLRLVSLVKLLIDNEMNLNLVGQQCNSSNLASCEAFVARRKMTTITEPTENVATIEKGTVVTGASANSDVFSFERDTFSKISYMPMGTIVTIDLKRVYLIRSLAFCIYAKNSEGREGHKCGFVLETSQDNENWNRLAIVAGECYSKQLLMFSAKKLRYVRIKGITPFGRSLTSFGISSFQCPAELSHTDKSRYVNNCPAGGTLHYDSYSGYAL